MKTKYILLAGLLTLSCAACFAGCAKEETPDPDAALLANERQRSAAARAEQALTEALDAADAGFALDAVSVCVDDALDALFELSGERASDAVIEEVFSKFCVGK